MIFAFIAVAATALFTTASAQTIGFADAIKILSASCGSDIQKYCKTANLGNNGIGQCLNQHQAQVSPQCNADRQRVATLIQARLAAQAAVAQLCNRDIQQYCKLVEPGAGHVLRCILKAEPSVSKKCNEAIDLAGYR
nr:hypothetical protein [Roseibium sp. RKSG952]